MHVLFHSRACSPSRAEQSPESVEFVKQHRHEIGGHGYDYAPEKAFDAFGYEEQQNELKR
jgi:hypothetical protein